MINYPLSAGRLPGLCAERERETERQRESSKIPVVNDWSITEATIIICDPALISLGAEKNIKCDKRER